MSTKGHIDRPFLLIVLALVLIGFFIFSSASLGLLSRGGAQFSSVAFSQMLSIGLGGIGMFILSRIPYRIWRPYSFYIFLIAVIATLLVFVPGIGAEYNGAKRWLSIGGFSIQPAEFLKIAAVMYFAALLASAKEQVQTLRGGLLPFSLLIGFIGVIMLLQPDTGTFMIMAAALGGMYFAAGAKIRHIFIIVLVGLSLIALLAFTRPYVMERFTTFLDPSSDPLGSGYQIQQSLIAVGSGEVIGRGFGQSIQKFSFLPEPIGDSIFSVAAEEFGFVGGIVLIGLFLTFGYRGLRIASHTPDAFGGLLALGIVIMIVSQSLINIGSMVGVMPLTGVPLVFISHGGTALLFALAQVGIVLNISRYAKR